MAGATASANAAARRVVTDFMSMLPTCVSIAGSLARDACVDEADPAPGELEPGGVGARAMPHRVGRVTLRPVGRVTKDGRRESRAPRLDQRPVGLEMELDAVG